MSGGVFFTHLLFLIPVNLCSSKKYCFLRINPATDKVCSLPHLRHSVGIPLSPYADSCVTRNASASTLFKTVCQFTDIPPLFFSLLSRRCNTFTSGDAAFSCGYAMQEVALCKNAAQSCCHNRKSAPQNYVAQGYNHAAARNNTPHTSRLLPKREVLTRAILSNTLPAYIKATLSRHRPFDFHR